jgi:hypothetical protein
LLLVLARAVIFGCESHGNHGNIYCLRFETSFLSPLTTRRATVGVFDPTSTRLTSSLLRIKYDSFITSRWPNEKALLLKIRCYSPVVTGMFLSAFVAAQPVFSDSLRCYSLQRENDYRNVSQQLIIPSQYFIIYCLYKILDYWEMKSMIMTTAQTAIAMTVRVSWRGNHRSFPC